MRRKYLSVPLSRRETIWGLIYLGLELMVLPTVLYYLTALLFPDASEAAANFLYYLVNFLAVCLIFSRFLGKNLSAAARRPLSVLLYSAAGLCLYWLSSMAMQELTYHLMPDFSNVNDNAIAQISRDGYFLMAVGTVILVPTAEECLFRGAIFRGIYDRSRFGAYLVSALSFSAIHVIAYIGLYDISLLAMCLVQYLPAGLILAWCFERSGTIFTPILIHTVINAIGIYSMR